MIRIKKKIAFIGSGNMGEAIIGALISAGIFKPSDIYISDIRAERLDEMKKTYGVNTDTDNFRLFSECDIMVMAVKPQQMDDILTGIGNNPDYKVSNRKLVISIAAGFPIKKMEAALYTAPDEKEHARIPIIRVMPNTPALVLSAMSGMSPNKHANADDIDVCRTILESMGRVIEFEESDLDGVTALSGSGPAYVFFLAESMIKGGIKAGIKPEDAKIMAIQTIKGAAKLMETSDDSPEELRRKVTSPGGTTEAALNVFQECNVKDSIVKGIIAADNRAAQLGQ